MDITNQTKHQLLIRLIQENNNILSLMPKLRETLGSNGIASLETNEINDLVRLIVTYLNLTGGSNSNLQLYKLLTAYFKDHQARNEINECVDRGLERMRNRKA